MTRSIPYEKSYVGKLRKLVGDQKLIIVTTRAVIRDPAGHVLFVQRSDNSRWVMPSGSLELDETLYDCMKREVREESGLEVISATPMAIYTSLSNVTAYGDAFEQISIQFLVTEWSGALVKETDETIDARFFPLDKPPEGVADFYHEVLEDLRAYDGQFILK